MSTVATDPVRAWRNALFVVFTICGVGIASWMARSPGVRDALGIDTAQYGLLIFSIAVGSILGLLAAGHLAAAFGAARVIRVALPVGAVGLLAAGVSVTIAPSIPVVALGLALFGAGSSISDVNMNLSGAANERALGRTVMPIYHAFFSAGAVIGAGSGALAEHLGISFAVHIGTVSVIIAAAAVIATRFLLPEDEVLGEGAEEEPKPTARERLAMWGDPRTLLIGVIVLGMAFAEGSANDWLAIAMVDGHGTDATTGAVALGLFVGSMTVGRLVGVRILDRFGRVPVLRVSAVLAVLGLGAVIVIDDPNLALVGVVLWGLGAALGFPVGMSAAADDPRTAAARVSVVATVGYCAFLVGPPLIGFVGEAHGIRIALVAVLVLIVAAGLASAAARERGAAERESAAS